LMQDPNPKKTLCGTFISGDYTLQQLQTCPTIQPRQYHLLGLQVSPEEAFRSNSRYILSMPPMSNFIDAKLEAQQAAITALLQPMNQKKKQRRARKAAAQRKKKEETTAPSVEKPEKEKEIEDVPKAEKGEEEKAKAEAEAEAEEKEGERRKTQERNPRVTLLEIELSTCKQKLAAFTNACSINDHLTIIDALDRFLATPKPEYRDSLALAIQVSELNREMVIAQAMHRAEIAERDREIAERDREIAERELAEQELSSELTNLKYTTGAAFFRCLLEARRDTFVRNHHSTKCAWPIEDDMDEHGKVFFSKYVTHLSTCTLQLDITRTGLLDLWHQCCTRVHHMQTNCIAIPQGAGLPEGLMKEICEAHGVKWELVSLLKRRWQR